MIVYGTLVHTPVRGRLTVLRKTMVAWDPTGEIVRVVENVPESDVEHRVKAFGLESCLSPAGTILKLSDTQFVMPGFVDTHIHAPQFTYTGTATDRPLMEWLNVYAFPAEKRFQDTAWACKVYRQLVQRLLQNGTTTALYFASIHLEATQVLADTTLSMGQRAYIGKVCLDQHAPQGYIETTKEAVERTEAFIQYCQSQEQPELLVPVVTPRFLPTCSPALLQQLGDLARRYNVPVQSHISESLDEVAFVKSLYQRDVADTEIFDQHGLLTNRTVMAHGVHLSPKDVDLLVERGSSVAVCPLSNVYFANGIFPAHAYHVQRGLKAGLGTDVAGGYSPSMLNSIRHAALASRYLATQQNYDASVQIDWVTGLYLATLGGARCLGIDNKIGTFDVGKKMDALLIDVSSPGSPIDVFEGEESLRYWEDLVEKFINLGDDRNILTVWVNGRRVM